MFIYPDGAFHAELPPVVTCAGIKLGSEELTQKEWDKLGYNKIIMLKREPFTTYRTQYVKGDDFIYREKVISKVTKKEFLLKDGHEV